ncbi:hypothetical protein [Kribbella sp. DT2]|uniref:hypothetical protein n=1 Tax=Kribbella sp. DT2 TaxID=3393427 RepID=UPI003CFA2F86
MKKRVRMTVVAGAAVAVTCLAGTVASAAPMPQEASASGLRAASSPAGGWSEFHSDGEYFHVCDTAADGRWVKGEVRWGNKSVTVTDTNGGKVGCGFRDLSIKEGTKVSLRYAVEGRGYSQWISTRA